MDALNDSDTTVPERIPDEWIDKLFDCMAEWYGERWTRQLGNHITKGFVRTVWQNGLVGLSHKDIKAALILCRRHSQTPGVHPPHVVEFFHYAKGLRQPLIDYTPEKHAKVDRETGRKYMREIRKKLGMKAV